MIIIGFIYFSFTKMFVVQKIKTGLKAEILEIKVPKTKKIVLPNGLFPPFKKL